LGDTEEEIRQEEFIDKIKEEYKDELVEEIRDEILDEYGEEYQVWIDVRPNKIQKQIAAVATSLKYLLTAIQKDNYVSVRQDILSDLEKQQLIALLEAALAELKGVAVDRGRIGHINGFLNRIFRRTVEKEIEGGFRDALGAARKKLGDLYVDLNSSIDQLDIF